MHWSIKGCNHENADFVSPKAFENLYLILNQQLT
jgi:hypothetical protein